MLYTKIMLVPEQSAVVKICPFMNSVLNTESQVTENVLILLLGLPVVAFNTKNIGA